MSVMSITSVTSVASFTSFASGFVNSRCYAASLRSCSRVQASVWKASPFGSPPTGAARQQLRAVGVSFCKEKGIE
jgi:hypothetical protein